MNRLVRIVLFIAVLIVGAIILVMQLTSYQKLTVGVKNGGKEKIFIYKVPGNVDLHEAEDDYLVEDQLVKQPTSGEEVKLKKGHYVVLFAGTDDLEKTTELVELGNKPVSISLTPEFTDKKREALLATEQTAINQVITSQLKLPAGLVVSKPKLFGDGSWYGALVSTPESQEAYVDVYKFVLHKEGGTWKVAAGPELSLSKITYPEVPVEILKAVNALTLSEDITE